MSYPSFHFHPSSPTTGAHGQEAASSSPARPGRALVGASKLVGRDAPFGRQPTPPASSSPPAKLLGTKRPAVGGPASGQGPAKRLVLGSLHPNAVVPVGGGGHAARRKQGASKVVVSGYATPPTSSSPVRPTSRRPAAAAPLSDDLAPASSSPPPQQQRRLLAMSLKRPVGRAADAPLPPRDASATVDAPTTSSSSSLTVPTLSTSSSSKPTSSTTPTVLHAPVPLSSTHTFLLGRTRSPHPLQPKPFAPLPTAIHAQLVRPQAAVLRLPLPRTAKHASRTHVVVELVGTALARVLVLGLNGARVQGRRVGQGGVVLVDALKHGEVRRAAPTGEVEVVLKQGSSSGRAGPLRIGFWGVEVVFEWPVGALANDTFVVPAIAAATLGKSRTITRPVAVDADETESEDQASSSSVSERSSSSSDSDGDDNDGMNLDCSSDDDDAGFQPISRPVLSNVLPPSSPPLSLASASSPLSLASASSPPPAAGLPTAARRFAPSQLARSTPSAPSAAPPSTSLSSAACSRPSTPAASTAAAVPAQTAKIILTRPAASASASQPPSTTSTPTVAPVKPTKPVPPIAAASAGPLFKPEPREAPLPVSAAPPPAPSRPAPTSIDLPSLLSSALVFAHVTSLAVPDLVRAVLETSPSLKGEGSIEEWESWVFEEVNKGGMWGRVIRRGKDASGQPLLDQYFYDPSRDADTTRATDLGSLMRPLRGTQRQGKTYFFKRPSTPGKKRK